MPARASHQLNRGAVQALLSSPQGPVGRELLRRGLLVESQAKTNLAGVGGPRRIDTGRLRASITTTLATAAGGVLAVRVGTNVDYAIWVHQGTSRMAPNAFLVNALPAARG